MSDGSTAFEGFLNAVVDGTEGVVTMDDTSYAMGLTNTDGAVKVTERTVASL